MMIVTKTPGDWRALLARLTASHKREKDPTMRRWLQGQIAVVRRKMRQKGITP